MTLQENSKPAGARKDAPATTQWPADLAELISAVLQHPDIPTDLHTHIGDWIASYGNALVHEPQRIRRALAEFCEDDDEPTGAASQSEAAASAPAYERYAGVVANLIAAEATPEILRTGLLEFCAELSNHVAADGECVCSDETRRRHLPALLARAERLGMTVTAGGIMVEKKGGAAMNRERSQARADCVEIHRTTARRLREIFKTRPGRYDKSFEVVRSLNGMAWSADVNPRNCRAKDRWKLYLKAARTLHRAGKLAGSREARQVQAAVSECYALMRERLQPTAAEQQGGVPGGEPRKRRRPLGQHSIERIRELDKLQRPEAHSVQMRAQITAMADALALWAHYVISQLDASAAAHVYRALLEAWRDNDGLIDSDSPEGRAHFKQMCGFNSLFNCLEDETFGRRGYQPQHPSEKQRRAELMASMRAQLRAMFDRLSGNEAAPQASPPATGPRLAELRRRLERLNEDDDITTCSARFKLEKQIHDLEREQAANYWPEVIDA
jgi:hypothetical protein